MQFILRFTLYDRWRCRRKGYSTYFSSAGSSLDLFSLFEAQSFSAEQTMYILTLPEQGTYGQIKIKNSPMRVLLGPVFPTPITEDTVMTVARRNLTDKKDMDALAEFLYSIPNCSYNQFVNLTALLNFIINGEMFDIAEQFLEESVRCRKQACRLHIPRTCTNHRTSRFCTEHISLKICSSHL